MDLQSIQEAILDNENILDDGVRSDYHCYRGEGNESNKAIAKSGLFCLAFPMMSNDNGSKLCYRIWRHEGAQIRKNAERIVKDIQCVVDLPYFVQCEYIPEAIKVKGTILSGLKMNWIEGETLDKYLHNNCNSPKKLEKLASDFLCMCKDLNDNAIVHGDLSNANILVANTGKLYLIDYDSIYLPRKEQNVRQTTGGTLAFQHPQRISSQNRYMEENDDYFSQQVIYLSLLSIAMNPALIELIGEEELLFTGCDFQNEANFVNSPGYNEIFKLDDPLTKSLLDELYEAVSGSLSEVKSICEIIEGKKKKSEVIDVTNYIGGANDSNKVDGDKFGDSPAGCGDNKLKRGKIWLWIALISTVGFVISIFIAKYWYDNQLYGGHDAKYWYDNQLYGGHDAKYWYDNQLYGGHDAKYWYDNQLYSGHDAKYWHDNQLYGGYDAKYWYDNQLYIGHDAKYWYDNRLYDGHDAKYWYDNRLYGGYDAKYWHDNRLYDGHDAKYWYDNRLYGGYDAKYWYDNRLYDGHDAKYWYDNRLYSGHDAKYWYEKYTDRIKPR